MTTVRINRRKYQRIQMVVPVQVRLAGSTGHHFQSAHTLDATATGVRLAGYRGELNISDIIEIQYRERRARFRVIWIHAWERTPEKHIGAECIDADGNIWRAEFPSEPDKYQEPE